MKIKLLVLLLLPLFSFGQTVISPTNPFTGEYYGMVKRAGINYTGTYTTPSTNTMSITTGVVSPVEFGVLPVDATFNMGDGTSVDAVAGVLSYTYAEVGTYTITTTEPIDSCFWNTGNVTSIISNSPTLTYLCLRAIYLTSLTLTGATSLSYLNCSMNNLTEQAVTDIITSLPDRTGLDPGLYMLVPQEEGYLQDLTEEQAATLTAKNWTTD